MALSQGGGFLRSGRCCGPCGWSPFPPAGGEGVGAETKSRACASKARQDGVMMI